LDFYSALRCKTSIALFTQIDTHDTSLLWRHRTNKMKLLRVVPIKCVVSQHWPKRTARARGRITVLAVWRGKNYKYLIVLNEAAGVKEDASDRLRLADIAEIRRGLAADGVMPYVFINLTIYEP